MEVEYADRREAIRKNGIIGEARKAIALDIFLDGEARYIESMLAAVTEPSEKDVRKVVYDRFDRYVIPFLANSIGYSFNHGTVPHNIASCVKLEAVKEPDDSVKHSIDGHIRHIKKPYFYSPQAVREMLAGAKDLADEYADGVMAKMTGIAH